MKNDKTILIIDDDSKNIFALNAVLKARKYDCVSANSAAVGLEMLKQNKNIAIVLMDMMMPEMDGHAVLAAVRRQGLRLDRATLGPDPHPASVVDLAKGGQLLRDLHEELRLQGGVHPDMLGPVMEMLGQAVGRRRIGELVGVAERIAIRFEDPCHRVAPDGRRDDVGDGRLEGLVMRGEGTVPHHAPREQARDAFRVHDEGPHVFRS